MDSMDGWRDILHFDFHGEHVLFSSLRVSSLSSFLVSSLLTVFLCAVEKSVQPSLHLATYNSDQYDVCRIISYALSSKWNPLPSRRSRTANAAFRAGLYWVVTLVRLLYMLLAMTFHVGLILVAVTTLSVGQFIIEYLESSHPHPETRFSDGAPLLGHREFDHSAEYLDLPTGTTDRLLATPAYPPRRKSQPPNKNTETNNNGTTIFAIDDGENTA